MTATAVTAAEHLAARLALLEAGVREAAERRGLQHGDDRFRGLYVSDEEFVELLAPEGPRGTRPSQPAVDRTQRDAVDARAERARHDDTSSPLLDLRDRVGLDTTDLDLLVIAAAPDLDARFERLYGWLHDDVTRRRATIGLALELAGLASLSPDDRRRFSPTGPLASNGLLVVDEPDRPVLTRGLRVPDRVLAHILGDATTHPAVLPLLEDVPPVELGDLDEVVRLLASGADLVYLRQHPSGAAPWLAAQALRRADREPLVADLALLPTDGASTVLPALALESSLTGTPLVAGPLDAVVENDARALTALCDLAGRTAPVVLTGTVAWDPAWSRRVPLTASVGRPGQREQVGLWATALGADAPAPGTLDAAVAAFRLSPAHVWRAAEAARHLAAVDGTGVGVAELRAGARAENASGLERLARRIEPRAAWAELVLPTTTTTDLNELEARVRHRDRVLREWRMRRGGGRGSGITALFTGESGTGKTMAAEVVAGSLGLDLYTIDLSRVVDKYIGETEKNLERIFGEAEQVNGVLFFDEADALFGKRSQVSDARDRYANIEVAYLLQRMESFDGLAVLATNLKGNVDEAFARRLDLVVDFPMPGEDGRRRLWTQALSSPLPVADDVDVDFLAARFELSGGNIRNVAIASAYRAADLGRPVSMADVVLGLQREYRKLGRLCTEQEFGPYHTLLAPEPEVAP